jgi:hypothetical protein
MVLLPWESAKLSAEENLSGFFRKAGVLKGFHLNRRKMGFEAEGAFNDRKTLKGESLGRRGASFNPKKLFFNIREL